MGVARIWVADTEPNQRFTLYTRGNVGEVFPHVMTALTGTLIGDAVRQGQVEVFVEMGVLRRHEVDGSLGGHGCLRWLPVHERVGDAALRGADAGHVAA